ncbi:MAG: DUF456 domain-containing protein [candidate division WOR-3 bacterium]|nr:MAG: DUF456 domain-containing protein [candidate division WOR-3 bacterium]
MASVLEILMFIIALAIMLVGLAGVIIPVLPGIPLIFAAAILYAALTGFRDIGVNTILIFVGLTALGLVFDYLANYFSVRKMGGSIAGAVGAVVGLMAGIFFGLLWIIVLPFVFAVILELIAGKQAKQALRSGVGSFVGLVFGGLTRFVIGCVMIGIFVWKVLS